MNSAMQNISRSQIFDAVKQMPNTELEDFVQQILVHQASKRSNNPADIETRLLKKIYRQFPTGKLSNLRQLRKKLEDEELSENEYQDLALPTDSPEEFHAQRMKDLMELLKMRGLALEETMAQICIKFPDYD